LKKKLIISRDVNFDEDVVWNWNDEERIEAEKEIDVFNDKSETAEVEVGEDEFDDRLVRGFRSLTDVYQRCNVAIFEPMNYEETANDPNWVAAMKVELLMIEKNETWSLVNRPFDKKIIGVKWVFKIELNVDGSINKYKARLVVKGYAQQYGIDFFDTFAPVARLDTIRLLLALSAHQNWKVYQLDVKSAFLNGFLEEEIYVEQPEGFVKLGAEDKVFKLKKALYGLKQAPKAWYNRIDHFLLKKGFIKSLSELTLYVRVKSHDVLIVSLYVDDLLITGSNFELVEQFKVQMFEDFEMTDLGEMAFFLGMEVYQTYDGIFIGQQKYAKEVLKKFNMEGCKEMSTPLMHNEKFCKDDGSNRADERLYKSLIGCLMYLTATRPDIQFAISLLSRFMHCTSELNLKSAKRVLRYIKGTLEFGIMFGRMVEVNLHGFSDSD